jgi:hypothetical protein
MRVPAGDRWPDTDELWEGYNGRHIVKGPDGQQEVLATVTGVRQDSETGAVIITTEYDR